MRLEMLMTLDGLQAAYGHYTRANDAVLDADQHGTPAQQAATRETLLDRYTTYLLARDRWEQSQRSRGTEAA